MPEPRSVVVEGEHGSVVLRESLFGQLSIAGNGLYLVLTHVCDDDVWRWELERSTGPRSRLLIDYYTEEHLEVVLGIIRGLVGLPSLDSPKLM